MIYHQKTGRYNANKNYSTNKTNYSILANTCGAVVIINQQLRFAGLSV
jgi:hypothetical protein